MVSVDVKHHVLLTVLNKFSSKYDTVTSLLVYHKYLEIRPSLEYHIHSVTLGTDAKFTLSFLSAKPLC